MSSLVSLGFGYITKVPNLTESLHTEPLLTQMHTTREGNDNPGRQGSLDIFYGDQSLAALSFLPPEGGIKASRLTQTVYKLLEDLHGKPEATPALAILQVKIGGKWQVVDIEKGRFCEGYSERKVDSDGECSPRPYWEHTERQDNTDVATVLDPFGVIIENEDVKMELHIVPLERVGLPTILLTDKGHVNPNALLQEVILLLKTAKKTPLLGTKIETDLRDQAERLDVKGVATPLSDIAPHKWEPYDYLNPDDGKRLEFHQMYYLDSKGRLSHKERNDSVQCDRVVEKLRRIKSERLKVLLEELEIGRRKIMERCHELEFNLHYREYSSRILVDEQNHMLGPESVARNDEEQETAQKELTKVVDAFEAWAKKEQAGLKELVCFYNRAMKLDSHIHKIKPLLDIELEFPKARKAIEVAKQEIEEVQREIQALGCMTVPADEVERCTVLDEQERCSRENANAERNRQFKEERRDSNRRSRN